MFRRTRSGVKNLVNKYVFGEEREGKVGRGVGKDWRRAPVRLSAEPFLSCVTLHITMKLEKKQWRLCFRFIDGDSYEVEIVDYH
jgi:hypothetical protein